MSSIGLIFGEIQAAAPAAQAGKLDVYADVNLPVQTDWTFEQAYLCLLLAGVFADGKALETEIEYVKALTKRCKAMRGKSANELAQINLEVLDRMKNRSEYLSEACKALPRDMHQAIFTHCVDVVLADGELATAEREFLDSLMAKLSIKPEDAKKILEVIFEKNRY